MEIIVGCVGLVAGFVVGFLVKRNNAKLFEEQAKQLDAQVSVLKLEVDKYRKQLGVK